MRHVPQIPCVWLRFEGDANHFRQSRLKRIDISGQHHPTMMSTVAECSPKLIRVYFWANQIANLDLSDSYFVCTIWFDFDLFSLKSKMCRYFLVGRDETEPAGHCRQTYTGNIATNVEESQRLVGLWTGTTNAWSEIEQLSIPKSVNGKRGGTTGDITRAARRLKFNTIIGGYLHFRHWCGN